MRLRWLVVFVVPAFLAGCGGNPASEALASFEPAALSTDEDVRAFASASAPSIYITSNLPYSLLGLSGGGGTADPNCPKKTEEGNTTRLTGDCTDSNGVKWVGTLVEELEAAGSDTGRITYDGFGFQETVQCNGQSGQAQSVFRGKMSVSGTQTQKTFELDLRMDVTGLDAESCTEKTTSAAWEYRGTVEGDTLGGGGRQTWSGSGRVGSSEHGVVTVETKDEVLDPSVCDSEALSGTTTLVSGSHTAVLTYDGQTDCDNASTVQWSLDGQARGELSGVSCSAASGPAAASWALFSVGALALLRRRARH
ncbi:MAG: hypothetical protein L0Y66_23270 [Myxococcaceae bacterium]|nr:hypothetical protein [Myxococcaceae bacterium]MCI0670249.1 hypothetical protein [Myxococcaceae bacterium]